MNLNTRSIPWPVWLLPALLLVIATARLPYGYYTFTRIVVCALAVLAGISGIREGPIAQVYSVVFGLIAILFNPVVPIHLSLFTWFYLDLGVAAIFVTHLAFVRLRATRSVG